jgi:hypothetical protein
LVRRSMEIQVLRLATELVLREMHAQQFGCFAQDDSRFGGFGETENGTAGPSTARFALRSG